jgi:hypothetical protein
MLAGEWRLRNPLDINVVYRSKLRQSITCLSLPHGHVQDVVILIHGASQVVALTVGGQKGFIHVPTHDYGRWSVGNAREKIRRPRLNPASGNAQVAIMSAGEASFHTTRSAAFPTAIP